MVVAFWHGLRGFLILLLATFFGVAVGYSISLARGDSYRSFQAGELVNPTVVADIGKHFIVNFKSLKEVFLDIQKRYSQKTYVYFQYLANGSWVGLGEKDLFTAASTIKVPLAMAVYKNAEEGRYKMTDVYALTEADLDVHFGTLYQSGVGYELSIEEFVRIMLEDSDNTAMNALFAFLREIGIRDPFLGVYSAMGWEHVEFGKEASYFDINLKTLSNMFLALYNATYVNIEHSQIILGHLTASVYGDALENGIPSGGTIANKSGVLEDRDTYSDCGIVYAPGRHYLICVGSVGASQIIAHRFISEISQAAYDYVIDN